MPAHPAVPLAVTSVAGSALGRFFNEPLWKAGWVLLGLRPAELCQVKEMIQPLAPGGVTCAGVAPRGRGVAVSIDASPSVTTMHRERLSAAGGLRPGRRVHGPAWRCTSRCTLCCNPCCNPCCNLCCNLCCNPCTHHCLGREHSGLCPCQGPYFPILPGRDRDVQRPA